MRRCGLILLVSLLMAVPVWAEPQVQVEQLNYDFGEVIQGEKVEFTFRFRNSGDQILELGNVRSSCGCTAALLSSKRIASGDTGELKATFDSTNFRGGVKKTITMETNDPNNAQVVFNLYGDVRAELVFEPERIVWRDVQPDQNLETKVMISNQGQRVVNLQPPKATNKYITAELSAQQLPPGGQVELKVQGNLSPEMARINGYVIIATDYKNAPMIRVPVSARLAK